MAFDYKFVAYGGSDRFQPCFGSLEPCGQPVVAFLVFSLVKSDMGVFVDAVLHEFRYIEHLGLKLGGFGFQRGRVK